MICREENKIVPAGDRMPDREARCLVTIRIVISRLLSEQGSCTKYGPGSLILVLLSSFKTNFTFSLRKI